MYRDNAWGSSVRLASKYCSELLEVGNYLVNLHGGSLLVLIIVGSLNLQPPIKQSEVAKLELKKLFAVQVQL